MLSPLENSMLTLVNNVEQSTLHFAEPHELSMDGKQKLLFSLSMLIVSSTRKSALRSK